ncbi:titin-like [Periplaneta americana]|uniref:titin-like n=1 Tax=Periplaneta americana TaxID=6978 RepID=UPI0037E909C2
MLLASLFLSSFFLAQGQQLGFLESPQNAELVVGEILLLKCVANATVQDCQWSWQSLEDGPNGTVTIVKTYPAFGDERKDCSVRFSTLSLEQQGLWSCGMRSAGSADFTVSHPAKVLVRSHKEIEFSELKEDVVLEAGKQLLLTCKTKEAVKECQWKWRPMTPNNETHLVVKTFPAFGNESQDCSIRLSSVLIEQEGFWTCGARSSEVDFTVARPIKLSVRQPKEEVEFSELTYDIEVSVGKPLILTCKTAKPVEECRWTWKPASGEQTAYVLKQFPSFGNESRDCSFRFDSVMSEQEGVWTCSARFAWQDSFTPAHPVQLSIFTGVAFVQLSQDIQIAIGEPVLLRCVTNIAVDLCRWSWQPLNRTNESSLVVKEFPAFGEEGRDCSVRFKSVLEEQEGIWICAVRLYAHSAFTTASPPATLTLLPAVRVKFLERPEDVRVAVGESALLRCIATTALQECQWTWRPLSEPNKTELVVKKFAAFGNYSRDCSVRFRSVLKEQEGLWGCTVIGPPNYTLLAAPLAKLSVYEPAPVKFVQLSKDIQMPRGSPILLRCLTENAVEECKWMWQPLDDANMTETEVKRFPAFGNHSRDCSLHMDAVGAEHEGNWTCAVRNPGETHFNAAPSARLTLLQPESVMVALWSAPENKVTLACRLSSPKPSAVCRWQHAQHEQHVNLTAEDKSERFTVEYNTSVGTCTIIFGPEMDDLGQWSCIFTVDTWEIASAKLMLLTAPPDEKLSWLVGVLAAMVLILTVLLLIVSVCRCRRNKCENKAGLGNPVLPGQSGGQNNPNRYTDPPAKINFQFRENPGRGPAPAPPTTSPQHIYERVDRYVSPTTCKSIYENVE